MQENGDLKNQRRLIRAIEIATALGKVPPLSKGTSVQIKKMTKYDPIFIGISLPPEELKKRIEKRLQSHLKKGMIIEVKNLHKRGLSWKRMDELGLEYRFVSRYLGGSATADRKKEMIAGLSSAIWHYAKRQMTWWKRDQRIIWMTPAEVLREFGGKMKK
jgi:tRNA dimethylallyltransferase